jgi:hypothetical protein
MFYKEHGCKEGFFSALNRCVTTSFFNAAPVTGKNTQSHPSSELIPRTPKILGQEQYLTIPTFIRQGKTLGL